MPKAKPMRWWRKSENQLRINNYELRIKTHSVIASVILAMTINIIIMITPGIKKLIENNVLSFSTVDKNNKPHSIAVACCKVFGNKIIITNTHIKESIRNLKDNKNVSLTVWNKDWEVACIGFELKGIAENETSGKYFDFVKKMPDNEGYDVKSAIVVTVTNVKKLLS